MRIAIQNSFPNIPFSAEKEFIARALLVCHRMGFDAIEVITSDDIMRFSPDCVLVTHEFSPKLTHFPTIGLIWSPPSFYAHDPVRQKSILSYDGWFAGSDEVAIWLKDFLISKGKRPLIHGNFFLPSSPDFGPGDTLSADPALMYVGNHWDGTRHGMIFRALSKRVPMKIYGPPHAWNHLDTGYAGALPCDGTSVIDALRSSGIALCLHKAAHRAANCPSMRLFEAASAGALIISDDFGFPRHWFRDSILYVDAALPTSMVVEQIANHVDWARANPKVASQLARRSTELFRQSLTLDRMLEKLPEYVSSVRDYCGMVVTEKKPDTPIIEYIVRIGSRPASMVARALESLANQTHQKIAVVLVQFHPVEGLEQVIEQYSGRLFRIRRILIPNNGKRSTAWWAGLKALQGEFFGILDDDDELHPNHVSTIMNHFARHPQCGFVYSGAVRAQEEPGHFFMQKNFLGTIGKTIAETRELQFLDAPDLARLASFDRNYILSHSWICRTSVFDADLLIDPLTEYGEDVYFYLQLASRTTFGFTGSPTAVWNWRSTSRDNSMLSTNEAESRAGVARMRKRLQGVALPATFSASTLEVTEDHSQDAVNRDVS